MSTETTIDDRPGEQQGGLPDDGSAKSSENKTPLSKAPPSPKSEAGNQNDGDDKETDAEKQARELDEELDKLEPAVATKRWVIGKPPELGGEEDQYSVYTQTKLGYMPRMRFFSLVTKAISRSIKASGQVDLGMSDVFGPDGGSVRERVSALGAQDFNDAGSFMALAAELLSETPDFLAQCYRIWLDVPAAGGEVRWFMQVIEQPWDPDREKWGLKEDDGIEMVKIFIDQNYEEIRRFFVEKIPALLKHAQLREKEQVRNSKSDQSKQ